MIQNNILKILEEVNVIEKNLEKELFDLLKFYDLTIQSYSLKKDSDNKIVKFLKDKNDPIADGVSELVNEQNDIINRYPSVILKTGFIYAVTQFEAFWSDITRMILKINYREFLSSNKKVSYEYLLRIDNTKTIIENLIDEEVRSFGYDSMKVQIDTLNKKYNLNIEEEIGENKWMKQPNAINYNLIGEIYSTRNLILHNRGVINNTYLDLNMNSDYKIGEQREINENYLSDSIGLLGVTSNKITKIIQSKYSK